MANAKNDAAADLAPEVKPEFSLTVIHPFGEYRRGDLISSSADIAAVLAGENKHHCHKVAPQ